MNERSRQWLKRTALTAVFLSGLGLSEAPALAQASGGRVRGGSFDAPAAPSAPAPPPSYPSGPSYTPGYDYPYTADPGYYPYDPGYYPRRRRTPVIVMPPQSYPVPSYPIPVDAGPGYVSESTENSLFLILVLFCGVSILPILLTYLRTGGSRSSRRGGSSVGELHNDRVTVTRVQIALLAQARYIQDELNELAGQINVDTSAGLTELLRETVLVLLRAPENWTHARVSSQTVNSRPEASRLFEQLSIQERSKFSAETLVNVGGRVRRQSVRINENDDPASYIVVTLLLGTADDQPLATSVHSAEELKAVLQRIGGMPSGYLMVFELLWSPQDASDSLSRDELLSQYPDLIQIA
ncbi:MAG: DUF1517 domain-containing protein [Synechococcales cyanobacterium M58_A2018_015]|nr:DUF1517 domain-containing protein [Synechococcales cyanobacterium M58_A2018_015]